jgi:hypothetical protein
VNLPKGTSRTYVTVYSSLSASQVSVDGKIVPSRVTTEAGLSISSAMVDIAAGQTVTVTVSLTGPGASGSPRTTIVSPPLVHDFPVTVVRSSDGTVAGTVKSSGVATIAA